MAGLRKPFVIPPLNSGGLITNYYCTSRCRHCLYACSPSWERQYIDAETTEKTLARIKALGCHSVHIGGGEPFLNVTGLQMVAETAGFLGVDIEYVETNSSWYRGKDATCLALSSLKAKGVPMVLVSISPFHNEHIPFYKVKGVIDACKAVKMKVFPWISDFYGEIDAFDDTSPHALEEYENRYGPNYLKNLPARYWIHFGGRALKTFAPLLGTRPYEEILSSNKGGCFELLNVNHFHFDLFENYIPGLCSGLAIHRDDVGEEITAGKYPLLSSLFYKGINGLFELGCREHGFEPAESYMSKCDLCLDLRRHLVLNEETTYRELEPQAFYDHV
ncbi:MAG: radical SAM protein [Thermodesulfobacteriota bacterium]|nr:radical SAM protein [Thermodesulfobacteriota bacterium]